MKNELNRYWVLLPDGTPMYGTVSDNAQSAMVKAMMMDIPRGCRVEKVGDDHESLPEVSRASHYS